GHLRLDFAALFFFALNINVPADQLAGEANVLPLFADGEGKLRILDDHLEALLLRIHELHTGDLGGAEGLLREGDRFLAVRNNVYFFAAQLANDGLDAHALHADAGADRVHVLIAAFDRDFGALSRFAGDGTDLDGAIVNFGHFHFKKALHQGGIGARDDDLRPLRGAIHGANGDTQAITDVVGLEAGLLALGQPGFGSAEVHDKVRAFGALHDAIEHLADAGVVFVVDRVALGLAHLLQNNLLRGLRGDSAQHSGGLGLGNFRADFDLRTLLAGFGERNFMEGIGRFFDHLADRKHVHLAGFRIELGAQVFFGAVILARRDDHRVFDCGDDHIRFDVLLPADLLDCLVQQTRHLQFSLDLDHQIRFAYRGKGHGHFLALQR